MRYKMEIGLSKNEIVVESVSDDELTNLTWEIKNGEKIVKMECDQSIVIFDRDKFVYLIAKKIKEERKRVWSRGDGL
jgi:hypothetical protein